MRVFFRLVLISNLVGALMVASSHAKSEDSNATQNSFSSSASINQFSAFDAKSRQKLDHGVWSGVLKKMVWKTGMSDRIFLLREKQPTGTNITWGSGSPYRLEGNKVFFHTLDENNIKYLEGIKRGYQALPNKVPLESLNKNEQLAYWLNLYNAALFYEIAERYPVTYISRLRDRGLWRDKLLSVNGLPLSLDDIQFKIIEKNWPNPLVIYGMWQGEVGGPNIQNKAFTGENVYQLLKENAHEFVNSLRGVHFRNDTVRVSMLYERSKALFPNWPEDLRNHLMDFADPLRVMSKLARLDEIDARVYDHHIADLYNGQLGAGPGSSQNTNLAGLKTTDPGFFDFIVSKQRTGSKFPFHVRRLLTRMESRNMRRHRRGIVTIDEIEAPKEQPPQNHY